MALAVAVSKGVHRFPFGPCTGPAADVAVACEGGTVFPHRGPSVAALWCAVVVDREGVTVFPQRGAPFALIVYNGLGWS